MSEFSTVAHVKRSFLAPTETFVINQIATLERYRPIGFCHHRVAGVRCLFTPVYPIE
jgi:hypothetical protein